MTKRRITAPKLLHLALPAVTMLSLCIAAPITSATATAGCPRDHFCAWAASGETGTRHSFLRYHDDLGEKGMPYGAYSVRNNTVAYWSVYPGTYCSGNPKLVAPGKAIEVDGYFSVAAEGYIGQCQAPN
ncbi:peptidase inhibitor family I36 protein [Streptomyces sp. NPDC058683]|uniref:peptidase inhibitor family I36 protein n=1 Tax=Streptomyces sp. NPDC058683 TaxID=3346597 RepID=UPI003648CEE4